MKPKQSDNMDETELRFNRIQVFRFQKEHAMRIRPSCFSRAGALLVFLAGTAAHAQGAPPKVDTGDTAWVLAAAALVMLMTPGLALFYGGMVRRKNALGTLMQSFICLGLVSVQWAILGYSLAFARGNPLLGSLTHLG